jgi:GR25 family glycosyltransferase involved in LPS biosynthesis
MNPDSLLNQWAFFDKIFCISVDARKDRRQDARRQFDKVGLLERVEFVIVKKHPDNCEQGIYEAHMSCIRRGIEADAANIAIFEDDILFERFSPARLERCIDFLTIQNDWQVLFFGCLVSGSQATANESVRQVKYRSLAHAYVLNRGFAEVLVQKSWQDIPFDTMLSACNRNCHMIYPAIAFQSDSVTDNMNCLRLEKFRRMFGGLRRIQKWNERYHCHKTIIIAIHVVVLALIILWII